MNLDKLSIQLKALMENAQKINEVLKNKNNDNEETIIKKLNQIKKDLEDNTCCGVCGLQ